MNNAQILVFNLKELRRLVNTGGLVQLMQYAEHDGICGNVFNNVFFGLGRGMNYNLDEAMPRDWLYTAFEAWPKRSGYTLYPVQSNKNLRPRDEWLATENKWVGEYGALRRELLEFCIKYLEPRVSVAK